MDTRNIFVHIPVPEPTISKQMTRKIKRLNRSLRTKKSNRNINLNTSNTNSNNNSIPDEIQKILDLKSESIEDSYEYQICQEIIR